MKTYYFTFGFGHHSGKERRPLSSHYTTIDANNMGEARAIMQAKRNEFATSYDSAEAAGVERFNLTYIPFFEVEPQDGPTL